MTIDKEQLKALAERYESLIDSEDEQLLIDALEVFEEAASPRIVLALLDEVEHLTVSRQEARDLRNKMGDRLDAAEAENEALRQIVSESATACGAAVSVECSLEFMAMLPGEIGLVVNRLKSQVATLQAEPNSYQSGFDAGRAAEKAHAENWRAEAEGLRKDARRYRFLREDLSRGKIDFCIVRKHWDDKCLESIIGMDDADNQIDAAMAIEAAQCTSTT